ncbi:uncharacterized protein SCHCODRAFT_01066120, partial [Schizophyllum commune H4-8]|uniref:uncharacterized protein n=1 Tax=Schizophyllum commune (strain H4-8 / FGSC 9210) TaxID=578458 RepID=UPI00215F617E
LRLPGNRLISPTDEAKYLGVYIDAGLTFKRHAQYASGKGTAAATALGRLARPSFGMPPRFIRQLFQGLVVPRMEYALPVWFRPITSGERKRGGTVAFATRLAKAQRLACKIATGALRSTSTDALDYHCNMLPIDLRLNL